MVFDMGWGWKTLFRRRARREAKDRPRVYITRLGRRYIKADELLRSERGREAVARMAAFDFGKRPVAPEEK